jgi:hypothetical protein
MTLLSTHSSVNRGGRPGQRAAAAALCAGALALVAGCSAAPAPLTPRMAISLAADETQNVNSMVATVATQTSGTVAAATTATVQMELKPALVASADATVSADGQTFLIDEIVSAKALYLKSTVFSAFTGQTGKPWIEIPFATLSGALAASLTALFQDVQNGDPLTQTKMLAASRNVRAIGTQVVNGVHTTHYTGTFTASAALASLPPGLRKEAAPLMKLVTGSIRFNAWIDAQHALRRLTEIETVHGETVHTTMNVTPLSRPVHIAVPPASQAVILTKSELGGM